MLTTPTLSIHLIYQQTETATPIRIKSLAKNVGNDTVN